MVEAEAPSAHIRLSVAIASSVHLLIAAMPPSDGLVSLSGCLPGALRVQHLIDVGRRYERHG